jgi:hypothetical protein
VAERISDKSLLQTEYAKLYSELISIAQANEIALVICSFNTAVNDKSPKEVISYYQECRRICALKQGTLSIEEEQRGGVRMGER